MFFMPPRQLFDLASLIPTNLELLHSPGPSQYTSDAAAVNFSLHSTHYINHASEAPCLNCNMAPPQPSYTKATHSATYPAIDPSTPGLSTDGKVVVVTGATGGIGRATTLSFAASGPRALILLGRRSDVLDETAAHVRSRYGDLAIQTHAVDICDAPALRGVFDKVAEQLKGVDILVHCAGVLAPVVPLVEADPSTFLDGYKTTVVGTLTVAQSVVLSNRNANPGGEEKAITFINLTTAGILFPPFPGMGAYVSSKMAAVKVLQAFASENHHVRLHNVHPGFLDTAMSTQLARTTKLPFAFDDSECNSLRLNQSSLTNMVAFV